MNARKSRIVRSNSVPSPQQDADVRRPDHFTDSESERVLDAMAIAVARELGRQAAREWWEEHHQ